MSTATVDDLNALPADEWLELCAVLAALYAAGATIDWPRFHHTASPGRRVELPTYPFEHQRYWYDGPATEQALLRPTADQPAVGAPVAGTDSMRWSRPAVAPGIEQARAEATAPADEDHPRQRLPRGDWFYDVSWVRKEPDGPRVAAIGDGCCVVFCDDAPVRQTSLGHLIAEACERKGQRVIRVRPGKALAERGKHEFVIDPSRPKDYRRLLKRLAKRGLSIAAVVHCWAYDQAGVSGIESKDIEQNLTLGVRSAFLLAKALAKYYGDERRQSDRACEVRLVIFAARPDSPSRGEPMPEHAAICGLSRTVTLESRSVRCQTIAFDKRVPVADVVARLDAELAAPITDQEVAYRDGERYVPLVRPLDFASLGRLGPALKRGGVYLVTGGLGGIGLALAGRLAERYGARLILTGRSALPPERKWQKYLDQHGPDDPTSVRIRALGRLRDAGAEVWAVSVDVADREAMRAVISEMKRRFGRLDGVFHAAGVLRDGSIATKKRRWFEEVLRPKVRGTQVLDEVTRDEDLDFMVLFSSIASLWGSFGQADYAAANRYLDAFAAQRQARGQRTLAINWGLWGEVGMGLHLVEGARRRGIVAPMPTEAALDALERALELDTPRVVIAALGPKLRSANVLAPRDSAAGQAEQRPKSPGMSRAEMQSELRKKVARLLELEQDKIDDDKSFADMGMDSMLAVEFIRDLEQSTGRRMTFTLMRDYPTIAALAEYLKRELGAGDGVTDVNGPAA